MNKKNICRAFVFKMLLRCKMADYISLIPALSLLWTHSTLAFSSLLTNATYVATSSWTW